MGNNNFLEEKMETDKGIIIQYTRLAFDRAPDRALSFIDVLKFVNENGITDQAAVSDSLAVLENNGVIVPVDGGYPAWRQKTHGGEKSISGSPCG
jgi:hypothetical protein